MNYQINTHCPNCFKPSQQAICVGCGFDRIDYLNRQAKGHHLKPFTKLGDYTIGRVLGEGGFAIVYVAKHQTETVLYAIKEYYPSQIAGRAAHNYTVIPNNSSKAQQYFSRCYQRFMAEAKLLDKCQKHPAITGVVRYNELFEQNQTAYLVMECVQGHSLRELLESQSRLESEQIRQWLPLLLDTLEKLHQRGIYHRDISPSA